MANDYMSDGGEYAPEMETAPEEKSSEGKTALLPIDFFEGKDLEPGTECKIRIARVQDDQVEVEYVPHTEAETPEPEFEEEPMAPVPSGMAEMMG